MEGNDLEKLRKNAAEGSIGAKIELAVLEIEDEHDVEKNLAFLEDCAEQEKWHLASHKASETEKNDLLPSGIVLNMNELANLYENSNPKNPLYNVENATEWREKVSKLDESSRICKNHRIFHKRI